MHWFQSRWIHDGGNGYAPVPRKTLIRFLAITGVTVVLDEFRTSKCCPGCGSEMSDVKSKHRVRRCTNVMNGGESTDCKLFSKEEGVFEADRDQIATINMCRCAYDALILGSRPDYMCRGKPSTDENLVELAKSSF